LGIETTRSVVNVDTNPRYAIVSYESRRDLEDPMRFFQTLDVVHLYRRAPWGDMVAADLRSTTLTYSHPLDLYRKLCRVKPDIVQALEPFALVTLPFNFAVSVYAARMRVPLVVVSLDNLPLPQKYGRLVGWAVRSVIRRLLARARLLVFVNDGARSNFLWAGGAPGRLRRLMYGCWGVDVTEFRPDGPRMTLRRRPEERVILFVGRLEPSKGVFDLLAAFRLLRESTTIPLRLVMAGDGRAAGPIRDWVRRQGCADEVDLLGVIKNNEVPSLMRAADILAAPSIATRLWAEQVGNVLLQAMACGLPVVSTRSGSIPEFVQDGFNGLLVGERNPAELMRTVQCILTDDGLRQRLIANGRATALERYDAAKNVRVAETAILAACL